MKRRTLLICVAVIAVVVAAVAVPLVLHLRKVSPQDACTRNMWMLWDISRSYSMVHSIPFDQALDPAIIAKDYVGRAPVCPSGSQPYAPFRLLDGPVCPNGHQLPKEGRRQLQRFWRLVSNGPKDSQDLLDALRDQSGLVRMGAIEAAAVTPKLADEAVIRQLQHIAATDKKYYYSCGPYNQLTADAAASDVLKKLKGSQQNAEP